jgi:hypothetical protein
MPLTTWTAKHTSVALPKTYHQLAVSRGTRWVATSAIGAPSPSRWSSHAPTARRGAIQTGSDSVGSCPPRTHSRPPSTLCW